jgi:hypothetical protein
MTIYTLCVVATMKKFELDAKQVHFLITVTTQKVYNYTKPEVKKIIVTFALVDF